jgi:tripeptide aminopeptidase
VLLRTLADELKALGLADVVMDDYGYVMATVPATRGHERSPVIGFIAHVDTSPEMPGDNVRPIVHERYDGGDIVLPTIRPRCCARPRTPRLRRRLVTTSSPHRG